MIPIRDHIPSGVRPRVTQVLIALNVGIFLYTQLILQGDARAQFLFDWSLIPLRLHVGLGYVTPLTAMFLHGGWLHLSGNMLFLWIFGDNVEARMGRWRYLGFYLTCGLIAALAEYLQNPFARVQILGASGAIAGVLGAYLRLFPKARIDVFFFFVIFWRTIAIPAWAVLGFWIGFQLYAGLAANAQADGIAYWEHIGGFAAGFLLSILVKRAPPGPDAWTTSAIPKVARRP